MCQKELPDLCLLVRGKASHSASLQEWQNSSQTKLVGIGPDGGVELPSNVPSTTTNKLYNDGGTLKFNGSAVGGGGGSSYTAGSGLTLVGTEFNTAGTGVFKEIRFNDNNNTVLISTDTNLPTFDDNSTIIGGLAGGLGSGTYNTFLGRSTGYRINGSQNTFMAL